MKENLRALNAEAGAHAPGKFAAILSNPPYQRELNDKGGEDARVTNVFHSFQEVALAVAPCSCMIYPGGRWLHGTGRGLKEFSKLALHGGTLQRVFYYSEAETIRDIFPGTAIRDGVTIALHGNKNFGNSFSINGVRSKARDGVIPIAPKPLLEILANLEKYPTMEGENNYYGRVKLKVSKASDDKRIVPAGHGEAAPEGFIKVLINDVYGPRGRTKLFFLPRDLILSGEENLPWWKIHMGTLQGREKPGDFRFKLADAETALSPSRIAFANLATEEEARNKLTYLSTKFAQLLLTPASKSRNSTGIHMASFLPTLGDYSSKNGDINWDEPLDLQIYKKFALNSKAIDYIEANSKALPLEF